MRETRKLYAFRGGRVEERHIRAVRQRKLYAFSGGRAEERQMEELRKGKWKSLGKANRRTPESR